MADDPIAKSYLRDIVTHAGPYNPDADYFVGVKGGQDIRVPMNLTDNGRTRVIGAPIVTNNLHIAIDVTDYFVTELVEDVDTWSFGAIPIGRAATASIRIKQGATPFMLEWPDTFWWTGDPPLISMEPFRTDLLIITTDDGGVTWLADLARGYRAPTP